MGDLGDLISSTSPLTGGYLLVVLAEPHSEQHKTALLKRLAKGKMQQQQLCDLNHLRQRMAPQNSSDTLH